MKKLKDILRLLVICESVIEDATLSQHDEIENEFDLMLNAIYGSFNIWDSTYEASFIAKKVDPIQYNYMMEQYKTNRIEELLIIDDKVQSDDMPETADNIIQEDLEDLDIISSNYKANVHLGVYDGVYYIKTGEYWEEIPVKTYQLALDIYNLEIKSRLDNTKLIINTLLIETPNIEIILSNFEPEMYLGKDENKNYYILVGDSNSKNWEKIEVQSIRDAYQVFKLEVERATLNVTLDEDTKAILAECNKRWNKIIVNKLLM